LNCDLEPLETEQIDYNSTVAWDTLINQHSVSQSDGRSTMTSAGRWRPSWCIPRHRIAVLVPFRNRDKDLSVLLNVLHTHLRRQHLDYVIIVIEQVDKHDPLIQLSHAHTWKPKKWLQLPNELNLDFVVLA
jgi:N-terminal region of glycosyl transferase group 7